MYHPTRDKFIKLSREGNLIPVYKEVMADVETPVSAFLKIAGRFSFLLESVELGEKIGRYSFLGSNPYLIFKSKKDKIQIIEGKKVRTYRGNPFEELRELLKKYTPVKIQGLPRFHGGAVGYIGYDMIRFVEKIPDQNPDDLGLPDMFFVFTDTILAFDHLKHKILVISNAWAPKDPAAAYAHATRQIDALIKKLKKPIKLPELEIKVPPKTLGYKSNMTKAEFKQSVNRAKEYIKAGDIFQVVLSQRFEASLMADPFAVYRALRTVNPSPYMYYLQFGDAKIIGSSPEIMVRLEGDIACVRPIAGTRPRGETSDEDQKLEKELLSNPKECAEHIMLVDLGRNDLGRVCEAGSVKVTELMVVERYSHVMHIVTNVVGNLAPAKDCFDLLRASFPAGTVSGAPKIRAMEIIDELEPTRRGPYAGAVGYFDFSGDLNTCITIRTIVVKGSHAYVQTGAGIVADSIPEREYEETVSKAKAMLKAIEMVR